jgi:hypothetical protein
LNPGACGSPNQLDHLSYWLCPYGSQGSHEEHFRLVGDEPVFLDQVDTELSPKIAFAITAQKRSKNTPKKG